MSNIPTGCGPGNVFTLRAQYGRAETLWLGLAFQRSKRTMIHDESMNTVISLPEGGLQTHVASCTDRSEEQIKSNATLTFILVLSPASLDLPPCLVSAHKQKWVESNGLCILFSFKAPLWKQGHRPHVRQNTDPSQQPSKCPIHAEALLSQS